MLFFNVFVLTQLHYFVLGSLECDPNLGERKPNPDDSKTYLYCNLEGSFTKKGCPEGMKFNATSLNCEISIVSSFSTDENLFLLPQYQAPDDLCGDGIPMTQLSAPVVCNPSISSCPDGYECTVYARTGTAYCCQNPSLSLLSFTEVLCPNNQVTYIEIDTGRPKSCVPSEVKSCPIGFTCNIIASTATRCCGKQIGCPFNSAGLMNTGKRVSCSLNNSKSCPKGFICRQSSMLNLPVCCSDTLEEKAESCPDGGVPLISPKFCSDSTTCPNGYFCANQKCCPITKVCPAGAPLNRESMTCSDEQPCPNGFDCITSAKQKYCCPSPEKVCTLPYNAGALCHVNRPTVKKYYFDIDSGKCLSFQHTQCGGNDNTFDTLEQCQGFCVRQQCPSGVPYNKAGVNAVCTPTVTNTCPDKYSCRKSLFGSNFLCCPAPESSCKEMVTAGTACFGRWFTVSRYYYDSSNRKCQKYEYFGCSGNNNNFRSKHICEQNCVLHATNVCNGVAALADPNNHLQRCSHNVPCPTGYVCNKKQYCCPIPPFACSSPMSLGNKCSKAPQRTAWYYNPDNRQCERFTYFGCGGTANRFIDRKSCVTTCVGLEDFGKCPKGMSPYVEAGHLTLKKCTLNVVGTCPSPSSCVRSTLNTAICCQSTAKCISGRKPYVIPGSDSVISCQVELDNCPAGYKCAESSVSGFYMCCSVESDYSLSAKRPKLYNECPNDLESTGDICIVNGDGKCPAGYTCIGHNSDSSGFCCPLLPKCKRGKTHFISSGQPQICGPELASCPQGLVCALSTVESVNVCCRMPSSAAPKFHSLSLPPAPACPDGKTPFYEPGVSFPKQCITYLRNQCPNKFSCRPARVGGLFYCCPVSPTECYNGQKALVPRGSVLPQTCNVEANNCPRRYSCQQSADGTTFFCCLDRTSTARCPLGSSEYLYGNRPLACPPGSTRCPNGYSCVESDVSGFHLCCSGSAPQTPMCRNGLAYMDLVTNLPQECFAPLNYCPPGYYCQQSTVTNRNVCCTQGRMNARYDGYCPVGQIPYVTKSNGEPRTCHMALFPCPTIAQYTCIYSSEKQNSYCCAPIDTALPAAPLMPIRINTFGCPGGSHPLIGEGGMPLQCNPGMCPPTYTCQPTSRFNTWQCCSDQIMFRKAPKIADSSDCEHGSLPISGRCMRLFYIGQKGCQFNEQCSLKLPEARCDRNYCTCPRHKLIHGSKCVTHCPDGFINIAARCHDLTTVVFMDSVEERRNGTIGGFCKATVVEDEQCEVENAFCNEKSITCQCKPGFELRMNFDDGNDTGSCTPLKDSKFAKEAPKTVDEEVADDVFYFIDSNVSDTNETEIENNTTLDEGRNETHLDLNNYLFQTDDNPEH